MLDGHSDEPCHHATGESGNRGASKRLPQDAASDERAAEPRERPDDHAVILEEAVRHGQGQDGEQEPDKEQLYTRGARKQSGVHTRQSRDGPRLDSAAAGG